ncbi:hypothetical protein [Vibrio mediterranei]|uniref:hypothetical protein n=1 Tax=Vibrio mediterranei TaxID=689 RepID=UPI0040676E2D
MVEIYIAATEYLATGEGVSVAIKSGTREEIETSFGDFLMRGMHILPYRDFLEDASRPESQKILDVLKRYVPVVFDNVSRGHYVELNINIHYNLS